MGDGESPLVPIKVTGLDVKVSDLPALFDRLLPYKWVAARRGQDAVTDRIVEKLKAGGDFEQFEVDFAERNMGPEVAKIIRTLRIMRRGVVALPQLTGRTEASAPAGVTPSDFVNKFREDASLVDDEVLQEVYGRVLAQEAGSPGSVSLETLRVLRYLDREAADAFSRMLPLVFDEALLPKDPALHRAVGVDHLTWVGLINAGLVSSTSSIVRPHEPTWSSFHFVALGRTFTVKKIDDSFSVKLGVHSLTRAGSDLARIADAPVQPGTFGLVCKWLRENVDGVDLGSFPGAPGAPTGPWKAL